MPESEVKTFKVVEGNREMEVFIPPTGDEIWDKELEAMGREKTSEDLKKNQKPVGKLPRKEIAQGLREVQEFRNRRKDNLNPKYY